MSGARPIGDEEALLHLFFRRGCTGGSMTISLSHVLQSTLESAFSVSISDGRRIRLGRCVPSPRSCAATASLSELQCKALVRLGLRRTRREIKAKGQRK